MRLRMRTIAPVLAACVVTWGCREAVSGIDEKFAGQHPAALITSAGEHVVSVDPATQRLTIRGPNGTHAISPAGDAIDLRGENAPLFAERADGSLLVVYPVKLGMKQSGAHHHAFGELRAQASRDGGRTWSAPRRIDGDVDGEGGRRGHNFADLAVRPNGDVVVSWLDSRAGKQGVQAAVLRPDLSVAPAQTVDPLTCQCCRTALFTSSKGDVWLAYRDLGDNKVRNMAYAVSGAGKPFELRGDVADDRWSVNGCPESGPRFAESGDAIWLAWFNGAANAIELASASGGGPFVRRATVRGAINHPDLGTLPDGRLILVYEASHGDKRTIEARVGERWAGFSPPIVLATDGAAPRYVRRGDRALLTYTSVIDGTPYVHVIDPLARIAGDAR